jgi:hypothetical protein
VVTGAVVGELDEVAVVGPSASDVSDVEVDAESAEQAVRIRTRLRAAITAGRFRTTVRFKKGPTSLLGPTCTGLETTSNDEAPHFFAELGPPSMLAQRLRPPPPQRRTRPNRRSRRESKIAARTGTRSGLNFRLVSPDEYAEQHDALTASYERTADTVAENLKEFGRD